MKLPHENSDIDIGSYTLALIRRRKVNWLHVSSILTGPTKNWCNKSYESYIMKLK